MAKLIAPKKRPLKQVSGWIRAGLQSGILLAKTRQGAETRIVNKTGCRLVLRSKYRDVWEGERFTLAPGESALVCWTPNKPYERLGAFVDTGAGLQRLPRLVIGQSTLACTKEICFSRSPSHKDFSISMSPRQ